MSSLTATLVRPRVPTPERLAFTVLSVWALAWLLVLSSSPALPTDNVEQLTWVRSLEWGYHKHPPLPTWLLWPLVQAWGLVPEASFVAGAAVNVAALWLGWRLARETSGPRTALAGLLLAMGVTYYSARLNYYNHNTVLMLLLTVAAVLSWSLWRRPTLGRWAAMGVVLGLGALTKYQIVMAALPLALLWLHARGWRHAVHRRGPLLALAVAALLFAPHAVWLVTHDFMPLQYAHTMSSHSALAQAGRWVHTAKWIGQQLERAAPSLLMAVPLLLLAARRGRTAPAVAVARSEPGTPSPGLFWAAWGGLPLASMLVLALGAGVTLQFYWGTPFLALAAMAAAHAVGEARWARLRTRELLLAFCLVQVPLLAWNWASAPGGIPALLRRNIASLPAAELAAEVGPLARRELGSEVRIIGGSDALAGSIALRLPERPLVLMGGSFVISPWVDPQAARRDGVLWVGWAREELPPEHRAQAQQLPSGLWWAVQPPGEALARADD